MDGNSELFEVRGELLDTRPGLLDIMVDPQGYGRIKSDAKGPFTSPRQNN